MRYCYLLRFFSLLLLLLTKSAYSGIEYDHNSLYLFGSIDLSYSRLSSDVIGEAANKDGYMWGGRLLGNYIYDRLSLNTGVGYFTHKYESEFVNNRKVKLTTRSVFLELNPMYRFTHRHAVGVLWNQIVGASFLVGPSIINNSANPDVTTRKVIGLNYYYSIPWKSWRMRLGLQVMRPLSVGNRSGFMGMFTVQLGFPVIKNLRQALVRKKRVQRAAINVSLEKKYLNFETDSAELDKKSKKFLNRLGKFLRDHSQTWSRLSVEGHTDSVGPADYNEGLSIERARSVVYELVSSGAPQEKIFFEGYGEEKLLDKSATMVAHQKNRRVEMHFVGDTNSSKIQRFFDDYKE